MKKDSKSINEQLEQFKKSSQPNYGRGMRKLRGILDMNQKEMAVKLNMQPQQLSALEKKESWTDEVLQRVSDSLNIPVSGLDYLASEPDLIGLFFSDNTIGDGGIMGQNNNFQITYQFGNAAKIDDLFARFDGIVKEWSAKVQDFEAELKKSNSKK